MLEPSALVAFTHSLARMCCSRNEAPPKKGSTPIRRFAVQAWATSLRNARASPGRTSGACISLPQDCEQRLCYFTQCFWSIQFGKSPDCLSGSRWSAPTQRNPFCTEVTMYRAVIVALASALLILPATELLARGGGGGHGGGGGGAPGGGGGGAGGGGGGAGGGGGGRGGVGGGGGGGHGGSGGPGGGRAGYAGGHMGRMHAGPAGPVGFRAGANFNRANVNRANVNRHVVANRFRHRKVFFNGGYGGDYYYSCYPIWNGYRWVNSCNWGNYGY